MPFSEFEEKYLNCLRSMGQTVLIAGVAAEAFHEFPANLPVNAGKDFRDFIQILTSVMGAALRHGAPDGPPPKMIVRERTNKQGEKEISVGMSNFPACAVGPKKGYFSAFYTLMSALSVPEENGPSSADLWGPFENVVHDQALAIMFAHFDGFLGDCLRVICTARPETLSRNKQLTWQEALRHETKGALIKHLTEEVVLAFGYDSIRNRVIELRKQFGLDLKDAEINLNKIEQFAQRRHLVIHNGGVVNAKYLRETDDTERKIGDPATASLDELEWLAKALGGVAGELFFEISTKFLGIAEPMVSIRWSTRT